MTEDEREAFYDNEIAPVLLELMRKCNAQGMPFLATVEYNPGEYGTSADLPARPARSLPMDWAHVASRCMGNADTLIGHLVMQARERGHASVYLKMLGVEMNGQPVVVA